MSAKVRNDPKINELLDLAGISPADNAARRWLRDALAGAQSIAGGEPRPSPARHNAPLDAIERAALRLSAAVSELRRHPSAYGSFWRFVTPRPARADNVENTVVISLLENIRRAASHARVRKTGRPPNLRKQIIVDLAFAFWVRFSGVKPSSDINNAFRIFAERFYEYSTGSSVDSKGHSIARQILVALKRLPIETERAMHLHETPRV